MAEATYFHSTLYSFNEDARNEVIMRFNDAMNDISARCWYIADLDTFELKGPAEIGAAADETLAGVIAKYVEDEIATAERDNRKPKIERFADSSFEDMLTPAAHDPNPQSAPSLPSLTLHLLNTEGSSPALKLFRLSELPAGLLERVLANPGDPTQTNMIATGYTCRAVCSDGSGRGEEAFNGRIGQALPALSQEEEDAFLAQAPFHTFFGTGSITESEPEPEMRHWRFQEGHEVNVKQWINGMGKTELYDPNERPVMPTDAVKMLVADQFSALGRVRVPKGAQAMAAESKYDSGTEGPFTSSKMPNFSALLGARPTGDSDSESSESASEKGSSDSDETAKGGKANFRSLLASRGVHDTSPSLYDGNALRRGPVSHPPTLHSENVTPTKQLPVTRSTPVRTARNPEETETARRPSQKLPHLDSYGKDWAAVDTIGLTARPDSQALWQAEHPSPRKTPRKRRIQLATRPPPTQPSQSAVGSVCRYLESADELSEFRTPAPSGHGNVASGVVLRTPITHDRSDAPAWENIVVKAQTPHGILVDDTASIAGGTPLTLPPGLGPPPGRELIRGRATEHLQRDAQAGGCLISIEDTLESTGPSPSRPLGFFLPSMRLRVAVTEHTPPREQPNDGDVIVERLHSPADEKTEKKYTMRQKAPNTGKVKGKGSVKAKSKVELPLPDPVPPPKKPKGSGDGKISKPRPGAGPSKTEANAFREAAAGKSSAPAQSDAQAVDSERAVDSAQRSLTPSSDLQPDRGPYVAKLEKLMADTRNRQPIFSLEIHFGILLYAYMEKSMRKGTFTEKSFRPNDVEATLLCLRLTTSTSDAKYVLELIDGASPTRAHSCYEFRVRDTAGNRRSIDCGADAGPLPSDDRDIVGSAYVHYPYRTWDAQYVLRGPPEAFATEAVAALVASVSTAIEAPSVYAKVPNMALAVEKVMIKREFYRDLEQGARIVVTEVQDLYLESLNHPKANLKATVGARDAMIRDQRLWWEAKIVATDTKDVARLQALVDMMVLNIDGRRGGGATQFDVIHRAGMTDFHDLSCELVEAIAAVLDAPTLCAFRLVSRECHDRCMRPFVSYLNGMRFLNAPYSLETLQQIARHTLYASKLETVRLSTHFLDEGRYDEPSAIPRQARKVEDYLKAQYEFINGNDCALLTSIIDKLPNLSRIEVGEVCGRFQPKFSRSYVLKKPIKELSALRYEPENDDFPGADMLDMLPLTGYYRSRLQCAFADLRSLELQMHYSLDMPRSKQWLTDFVELAPRLQHLHLSFDGWIGQQFDFEEETPASTAFGLFCRNVRLPRLQSLIVSNTAATAHDLRMICETHAETLSSVTFNRVVLFKGTWKHEVLRRLHHGVNGTWTFHFAWLLQLGKFAAPNASGHDLRLDVVIFKEAVAGRCERCKSEARQFTPDACEHVKGTVKLSVITELPGCSLADMNGILVTGAIMSH
ncbi:hypothetical protein B0A55_09366 [Friedmanniomyces simplex]|uniref:Uncharacterized protein n=1 Tax=Friedmanniomyces simplex TaxID=329884 RepID=A0A4U0WTQ8_9PEZI|nr:hypothetical protein B0A55_09366 [Friedmanniomyces simplex]